MPGDIVSIRQDIPNKPIMIVKDKASNMIRGANASHFKGIRCSWFSTDGKYQESVFNTKDLIHLKKES